MRFEPLAAWPKYPIGESTVAQRRQHGNNRKKNNNAYQPAALKTAAAAALERKPPVKYGKPFVVLEDVQKSTFVYQGGQWVRHEKTIAECRADCQVKELSQKINGMTRYEICSPVPTAS
jgi:hypothetical protein